MTNLEIEMRMHAILTEIEGMKIGNLLNQNFVEHDPRIWHGKGTFDEKAQELRILADELATRNLALGSSPVKCEPERKVEPEQWYETREGLMQKIKVVSGNQIETYVGVHLPIDEILTYNQYRVEKI